VSYAKQGGYDDPDAVLELDLMTSDQLATADLGQYAARLSRATREEYQKKQQEVLKPEGTVMAKKIDGVVDYFYRAHLDKDPNDKGVKQEVQQFKNRLANEINAIRTETGKYPTDINKVAYDLMANRTVKTGFFDGFSDAKNVYAMDISDVPEDVRGAIETSILNDGFQGDIGAEVIRRYQMLMRRMGRNG
jgi:hypothetical protein